MSSFITSFVIGAGGTLFLLMASWPFRTWLAQGRPARTLGSIGLAAACALAFELILSAAIQLDADATKITLRQNTSSIQARANELQERFARYRKDIDALGTRAATASVAETADWIARQRSLEAERVAASTAADALAADFNAHKLALAQFSTTTEAAMGWSLFAAFVCFATIFTASFVRSGRRITRS